MRRRAAVLVAVSSALAGCGAEAPTPPGDRPGAEAAPEESPLAAYPGFGHDPEADEARHMAEEVERENLIAACMRRKGFHYTPAPAVDGGLVSEAELEREEREETAYLESLSPSEWKAYSLALAGVPDLNDEGSTAPTGGCFAEADRAIPGVYRAAGELAMEFERMEEVIARDARVRAAEQRWSECMGRAGHGYATPRALVAAPDRWTAAQATDEALDEHDAALAAGERCEGEAGLREAEETARLDHETAFVERYRDVLDRYGR